jgi:hypothetical protein
VQPLQGYTTRGPELYIMLCLFFFLATIAVGTRFYLGLCVRKWHGADDIFILMAWVRFFVEPDFAQLPKS